MLCRSPALLHTLPLAVSAMVSERRKTPDRCSENKPPASSCEARSAHTQQNWSTDSKSDTFWEEQKQNLRGTGPAKDLSRFSIDLLKGSAPLKSCGATEDVGLALLTPGGNLKLCGGFRSPQICWGRPGPGPEEEWVGPPRCGCRPKIQTWPWVLQTVSEQRSIFNQSILMLDNSYCLIKCKITKTKS